MSDDAVSAAIFNASYALPGVRKDFGRSTDDLLAHLRTAARAIPQLWGDVVAEEEQRKAGQKALAFRGKAAGGPPSSPTVKDSSFGGRCTERFRLHGLGRENFYWTSHGNHPEGQ